jgi:AcrR family transcriptional regulator
VRKTESGVRDRRVLRTQRLLQDSLRNLLSRKTFDEILVSEITETADVNRATFYDHFTDKYDLFNALIAEDFEQLLAKRKVCFDGTCASGLAAIVLAVGDYLEHLHRDKPACSANATSGPLIDSAITLAIRKILLKGFTSNPSGEVLASLLSGGIYSAVKQILNDHNWQVQEPTLLALVPILQPLLPHHSPQP